jgi:mRNA-degrading endonuclease RelE of RelBE toxin-antitoxin system
MKHIELSRRAERDLRRLDKAVRKRLVDALRHALIAEPPPEHVDIKVLRGAEPWLRLRIGTYRVVYRPLAADELRRLVQTLPPRERPSEGYVVERIIHRRDLDRAMDTL